MIHLVHFWIKEDCQTDANRAAFEAGLSKLCACPLATQSNWGVPAKVMERPVVDLSWDYNLVTYFETAQQQDAYQTHPDHLAFLDEFRELWERVLVMDAELKG